VINKEIYFVTDIETSGQCYATGSILTIGSVPVARATEGGDLQMVSRKSVRQEFDAWNRGFYIRLQWHKSDAETMAWWADQDKAVQDEAFRAGPRLIQSQAMWQFGQFITQICHEYGPNAKPVFVSRPTGFDFGFIYPAFFAALGACPFGRRALDLRSFWMGYGIGRSGLAGSEGIPLIEKEPLYFKECQSSDMDEAFNREKFEGTPHNALDDARHLAKTFINMMKG
jgi:hypothetical protein